MRGDCRLPRNIAHLRPGKGLPLITSVRRLCTRPLGTECIRISTTSFGHAIPSMVKLLEVMRCRNTNSDAEAGASATARSDTATALSARADKRLNGASCRYRLPQSPPRRAAHAERGRGRGVLSRSRFRHLFAARTGTTVRANVLWRRFARLWELVAASEALSSAAQGAGFAEVSHLPRTSRRMFGLPPSALLPRALPKRASGASGRGSFAANGAVAGGSGSVARTAAVRACSEGGGADASTRASDSAPGQRRRHF